MSSPNSGKAQPKAFTPRSRKGEKAMAPKQPIPQAKNPAKKSAK